MTGAMDYDQRVLTPDLSGLGTFPTREGPAEGLLIPNLSLGPREALHPHFDMVNLTWEEFRVMTRQVSAPDTELFTRDSERGLRGLTKEQDRLWGLANEPGVRVLLHLAACVTPQRALVIGSGTGLLPIFLAATAAEKGTIDAVDLSYQSPLLEGAVVSVPRADLEYVPRDSPLQAGHYIRYARSQGIRPDVMIAEHGMDSTRFFQMISEGGQSIESPGYDLIFVDGAHTYAQAKIDLMYSWAMLRPGGVLVVDDFDKSHVMGLEAVTVAIHPILDDGYIVFFVGEDDRRSKTQVAFAVKDPAARRPGFTPEVESALARATDYTRQRSAAMRGS